MTATVINGDCLAELKNLPDGSVDSVVTDPPYNLSFMGKSWDSLGVSYQSWCEQWARECLRVLKPGGHLLAFGGTRTYHRLTSGIEDAGFEIRDSLHWIYGSGFPKSLDVSKAIDKRAGAQREVIGTKLGQPGYSLAENRAGGRQAYGEWTDAGSECDVTAPATEDAARWSGWGTALKPAHEPIVLARKPLGAATVAANVTEHGCGGINVDECRIEGSIDSANAKRLGKKYGDTHSGTYGQVTSATVCGSLNGRWPANILLTHSPDCTDECTLDCPVAELDQQSGHRKSTVRPPNASSRTGNGLTHGLMEGLATTRGFNDSGGASRFFYCAKAPRKERPTVDGTTHPTVKPLALIRWLTRLVTPVGGTVLDPFAGSGTTGQACALEGFNSILIEREPAYIPLIEKRLADGR